ncbi:MAG: FAD-binding oxidoreductase [Acidobacteria bacterium]|nr:FAD-binding oxidoreductase [Acidobacteriota bacterium]MCA1639072.1 FAD-binding oxidoreductase [Acidobacteriota bacterium]
MIIKTQADKLLNYLTDASNLPGGHAEKLFVPESAAEIAEILKEANEKKFSVTVSGARTGTVGGAIPFGGVLISMDKLNRIKEINNDFAVVESGVLLTDFQKAVDAKNLFYPPDPTEWSCQIGGTVATNASGARSFKYGATRKYVERLEVVLSSGELLNLRRGENFAKDGFVELETKNGNKIKAKVPTYLQPKTRKNTSGYFSTENLDAIDLFIGSEGTLGVITEIELTLLPKPQGFLSGIVFFEDEKDLLNFVNKAREISFETRQNQSAKLIDASLLEYFDENSLKFISEKFPETPENMAGAIFFEQETTEENEDVLFEQWNNLLEKYNADVEQSWFTTTEQDLIKMRDFRHALPVSVNERIVRYKQKKVGTDMAVPDEKFASFLKFYKQKLNTSGLDYVIFGHIGDNHLHANILPKDETEARKAKHLYGRFIAQAVMLGGTISAEHGIGKLKRHYLYVMYGERFLSEMIRLKRAFDPNGILGRGNMFDERFL